MSNYRKQCDVRSRCKDFWRVTIADDIKIGAGAIVVNSFTEPGITIGGIPAKRIK